MQFEIVTNESNVFLPSVQRSSPLDPNEAWKPFDLTQLAGGAAAVGAPSGFPWEHTNSQHVIYRSGDGRIHELWYAAGANAAWKDEDLTAYANAPLTAGDPQGHAFESGNAMHVVYRTGDGHVHLLRYDANQPSAHWVHSDLTAQLNVPAAASDPMGFAFAARNSDHIVYRSVDNHIHLFSLSGVAGSAWTHIDLTSAVGAPAATGDPSGFAFEKLDTIHINYRSADGRVIEILRNGVSTESWFLRDLTQLAGAPMAAGDPSGWDWSGASSEHVVYRAQNGHIIELRYELNLTPRAWAAYDLTALTGAPAAVADPAGYVAEALPWNYVMFRGANDHVYQFSHTTNAPWRVSDITQRTGAANSQSAPFGYFWEKNRSEHVVFQCMGNHICELYHQH